ncbi:MAG: hypothetical protein QM817_15905 [Archangium sp.]
MIRPVSLGVVLLLSSACATSSSITRAERLQLKANANTEYDAKQFAQCAATYVKLGEHYSAACCFSLAGDKDAAFAQLAVAEQDRQPVEVAWPEKDGDLEALRADPRWATFMTEYPKRLANRSSKDNRELTTLFEADQGDRQGNIDWKVVGPRDLEREKRVDEILSANGAKTADDFWHAAMVFQHGATVAHIEKARSLALEAVKRDPDHDSARWLAAAALDRKLMYEGKPQKFGTQYKRADDSSPWKLWQVDPSTTDEERIAWNVPTLEQAKAREAQMNAAPAPK